MALLETHLVAWLQMDTVLLCVPTVYVVCNDAGQPRNLARVVHKKGNTMTKRRFLVGGTVEIDIEFNDDLLPDDEWREVFYQIYTLEDLAKHLAWNLGIRNARLSPLDGFADRDDSQAHLIDVDVDLIEAVEIIDNGKET